MKSPVDDIPIASGPKPQFWFRCDGDACWLVINVNSMFWPKCSACWMKEIGKGG